MGGGGGRISGEFEEVARPRVRASAGKQSMLCREMGRKSRSAQGGGRGEGEGEERGEANTREAGTLLRPEWRCRVGYAPSNVISICYKSFPTILLELLDCSLNGWLE